MLIQFGRAPPRQKVQKKVGELSNHSQHYRDVNYTLLAKQWKLTRPPRLFRDDSELSPHSCRINAAAAAAT